MTHRENNFDFIRFLAASLVLFSHSYALTGMGGAEPLVRFTGGHYTFGGLSVRVFFVISGFLVCQSWIRRPQVAALRRRPLAADLSRLRGGACLCGADRPVRGHAFG